MNYWFDEIDRMAPWMIRILTAMILIIIIGVIVAIFFSTQKGFSMNIEFSNIDPSILTADQVEALPCGSVVVDVDLHYFWMRFTDGFLVSLRDGTCLRVKTDSTRWRHKPDAKCVV